MHASSGCMPGPHRGLVTGLRRCGGKRRKWGAQLKAHSLVPPLHLPDPESEYFLTFPP